MLHVAVDGRGTAEKGGGEAVSNCGVGDAINAHFTQPAVPVYFTRGCERCHGSGCARVPLCRAVEAGSVF